MREIPKQIPKVGCVGAGHWGRNLIRNFHGLGALEAVAESNSEAVRSIGADYPDVDFTDSYQDLLENSLIQGIVIATPAETHGRIARDALLAGKDVFVEKPLCLNIVEGEALVNLAESEGRILMVGHLLWYHAAVRTLKTLMDAGELGRVQYIYSNRLNFGKIRREENILWSFAPHDISVILGLLEEEPVEVQTQGGFYLHQEIADVTLTHLRFASGVRGHIFVSWLHPFKEQKLVIVGDKKMAVFDDTRSEDKLVLYQHEVEWLKGVPLARKAEGEPIPLDLTEPLKAECQHFLERLVDRKPPRTDGREALRVLRVLRRAQDGLRVDGASRGAGEPPFRLLSRIGDGVRIHESSYVDENVQIGDGTAIWHYSHVLKNCVIGGGCSIGQNVMIGPDVRIGEGVKIQNNVSVYKGVTLEDGVFCGPSMVFTNVHNPRSEVSRMDELRPTLVQKGASLGANCTIVCGVTIGRYSFVGAGAVVLHDVPNHALIVGNPAREVGWICACGERLDESRGCVACGTRFAENAHGLTPIE